MFTFHQTMLYFYILLYVFIAPCTQTLEIQHQLTVDPFQNEVISVEHSINKRSIKELSIKAKINGADREFILQSAEGFFAGKDTKIWLAERVAPNATKFKYTLQKDIMEKVNITFYRDRKTQSAITSIINEEGISELNGIIDFDKTINPFEGFFRKRRDVPSKSNESNNTKLKNDHVIHNRTTINNESVLEEWNKLKKSMSESSLGAPDIVYPEILVYVDKSLFEYFEKDIVKTVAYTLTLWNGADLYFREIENPKVRLNIAGIVLCQDQIIPMDPFVIDETIIDLFGQFMYNEEKFELKKDYDVSVLLGANLMFKSYIKGKAFVGKACLSNDITRQIQSTAVIVDDTELSAMNSAAHELAHLFGAEHDGKEPEFSIWGGPLAKECSEAEGFVMSGNYHDKNQYHFSPCSQRMMSFYFSLKGAECLRNNPADNRTDEQILRILPGKYMSLDEQCQKLGFIEALNVNPNVCVNITCLSNKSEVLQIPAIEGSPCDFGKFCLRGECVKVPFNENKGNEEAKILFPPPYYQLFPGFNKSPEDQCEESNITELISSIFKDCTVRCLLLTPSGELMLDTLLAQDGSSCGTNGYCYRRNCVDGDSGSIIKKEVVTTLEIDSEETDNVTEDLATSDSIVSLFDTTVTPIDNTVTPFDTTDTSSNITDTPSDTTDTPSDTTDTPSDTTDTLSDTTDTLSDTTDTPSDTTDTPSDTIDTSSNTTDTPSEKTDTPFDTTDTSSNTTDTPSNTTDTPSDTTDTPSDTTDTPSDTTDTPSDTTDTPSDTTDTPSNTTDTPSDTTDTPSDTTDTPSDTTDTPSDTTDTPSDTTDTPSDSVDTPSDTTVSHFGTIVTPIDTTTTPYNTIAHNSSDN